MIVTDNSLTLDVSRQYNLNIATNATKLEKSTQLSNGQQDEKIAEVSLSGNMKKQAKDKSYEINDAQEAISLYQVADMSLAEMNKKLYRIAQLSAKASSDNATNSDKQAIQEEISKLRLEIQNVGEDTMFNNQPIFSNVATTMNGANGNTRSGNGMASSEGSKVDIELEAILADINEVDVTTEEGATKAINQTLQIMSKLHDTREKYISKQNEAQEKINGENVIYGGEEVRDTDAVTALVNNLNSSMLGQSAQAIHVQSNKVNSDVLALLQ